MAPKKKKPLDPKDKDLVKNIAEEGDVPPKPKTKKRGFPVAPPEETALPPEEAAEPPAEGTPEEEAPEGETGTGIKKETEEDTKAAADLELETEIDDNFKLAWESERDWIEEAKEDIKFKAGVQWSDEDKQILKLQKRPALTFNKIKAIIKLVTGHFIQNSARIQVSPEGGEDQRFSDVADRILQHVDENSSLEFNMGYLFAGGQTTGRGHIELHLDYENDPIFGQLKSIYHGRPGVILMDPRGSAYDLNQDRQFGFKLIKKTKAELKDLYPDKAAEIDEISMDTENPGITPGEEGDANNYGKDPNSTTIGINKTKPESLQKAGIGQWWVKEYWRFKRVSKHYVYFVIGGDMPEFDTKEEAEAEAEKRKAKHVEEGGFEDQFETIIKERRKKEMHVAIRCGGIILTDGKSPFEPHYTGFPFFQNIADWTPEAENLVEAVQGIVRCLKDPQREKNKARSQFLHIINTAANSGWIIDEDAMDPARIDELKSFGSMPGLVVQKKTGTSVQKIEPTPAPMAQQIREKAANDDFKEVSGINSDLLAMDESANPSGKAIALRIRQAITILEPDFRNFRLTKKLLGTAIVQMIPTLFDVRKVKKVLGENFMANNKVDDAYIKSFLIQIEDLKYNVKIAEQGDTKTNREETLETLMKLVEKGMQIPFEVLAEFMSNIPNKQEVINKITAYQQQQAQMAQALAASKGGPAGATPGAPPPGA